MVGIELSLKLADSGRNSLSQRFFTIAEGLDVPPAELLRDTLANFERRATRQDKPATGRIRSAACGRRLSSAGYQELQFVCKQLTPGPRWG
jgi:hypothetical protein